MVYAAYLYALVCILPLGYVESKIACSAWPNKREYGCTKGGSWEPLDYDLKESDVAKCEELCKAKRSVGCCYLSDNYGCQWKPGQTAAKGPDVTGYAIDCIHWSKSLIPKKPKSGCPGPQTYAYASDCCCADACCWTDCRRTDPEKSEIRINRSCLDTTQSRWYQISKGKWVAQKDQ